MVDLAGFGDLLRNLLKDVEGGAGEVIRPIERVGQDVTNIGSGIREDIGSAFRKDIGDIGSTIRRDFSSFGDFLRSHKLGLGLLGAGGLAGLGAYEYLKSRNQSSGGYNSQVSGGAGAGGYSTAGGGAGAGGGQCDPTCGQIPDLPPCPQCLASGLGYSGTAGGAGLGGAGSIFSDPLIWIIIAILIIIIVGIIMYYHKKKKKGG